MTQTEFDRRIEALLLLQNPCVLCPNRCAADRNSRSGKCNSSGVMEIASSVLHFGEEPCVSGKSGSGNIFFAHCNMRCVYCQNHEISQPAAAAKFRHVTPAELSRVMLDLQDRGAANINLVSGSHFLPQITAAIKFASADGHQIPILYNTNGYDEVETLKLLEGIIDIYLPDLRYSSERDGFEFSGARDYPLFSRLAVKEMFRQVSDAT
ncbi:MAG: radical SAM protein, partial [Deltaproteobacteria bacterium]|nr:radical SAM protein [Deltaproteobacteria bacterium]